MRSNYCFTYLLFQRLLKGKIHAYLPGKIITVFIDQRGERDGPGPQKRSNYLHKRVDVSDCGYF